LFLLLQSIYNYLHQEFISALLIEEVSKPEIIRFTGNLNTQNQYRKYKYCFIFKKAKTNDLNQIFYPIKSSKNEFLNKKNRENFVFLL